MQTGELIVLFTMKLRYLFPKESHYAELLIVDPDMSFKDRKEEVPSAFIREVLAQSK